MHIIDNVYANERSTLNESINESSLGYIYITTLPMAIPKCKQLYLIPALQEPTDKVRG